MGLFDFLISKKKTPEELLKNSIENQFEKAINDAFKNNPMKGTPMEGMHPYASVGLTVKELKNNKSRMSNEFGLSEDIIHETIDEVAGKILRKYFRNFDDK